MVDLLFFSAVLRGSNEEFLQMGPFWLILLSVFAALIFSVELVWWLIGVCSGNPGSFTFPYFYWSVVKIAKNVCWSEDVSWFVSDISNFWRNLLPFVAEIRWLFPDFLLKARDILKNTLKYLLRVIAEAAGSAHWYLFHFVIYNIYTL